MTTRQQAQDAYHNGRVARMKSRPKSSCPFDNSSFELKHWWLAGYNDKAMELAE